MKIYLIWAQDKNGGIGKNGRLPWMLPEDLKNFKKITLNSTIVMGRKTWDSLKIKPLPQRRNIVLSSKKISGVECYISKEAMLNNIKKETSLFIIGGSQIYNLFYPMADELHITFINKTIQNIDTFFPIKISCIETRFKKISSNELSKEAIYSQWKKK